MAHLNYGLIGNCRMNALVSAAGSIDWACMPDFDSPAVFSAILDADGGGFFSFETQIPFETEQQYLKNTVILETRFFSRDAGFNVLDFMPRFVEGDGFYAPCQLFRLVEVSKGAPVVRIRYEPKLNYTRGETRLFVEEGVLVAEQGDVRLYLHTNVDCQKILNGEWLVLEQGTYFALSYNEPMPQMSLEKVLERFRRTSRYWRTWVKHCYLPVNYQTEIIRSALTLKMLVFEETGAVIAAPTTSIPEVVGGNRTWDYRYCWLRDSYFIVSALMKLSQFEELEGFVGYLKNLLRQKQTEGQALDYIRPLYTIYGKPVPEEEFLDHFSGFLGSQPVRIGNGATTHFQNDIYGELVQALYPMFFDQRIVREDSDELWEITQQLVELAIAKFDEEDNGIWEFRNARRHYTFSKLMCWVGVDRGVKIARHLSAGQAKRWAKVRKAMEADILARAWNPKVQAFTQAYGSDHLDASNLLMPAYGFISARDPRMKSTIVQSEKLLVKNGFAFRYTNEDDFGFPETSFLICTFWFIDALILAGEMKKARMYFDNILQYANHVGLFSEDIDPLTGVLSGNFPQGYTHVAIINTAMKLNKHDFSLS